jgi:hypothetical protein
MFWNHCQQSVYLGVACGYVQYWNNTSTTVELDHKPFSCDRYCKRKSIASIIFSWCFQWMINHTKQFKHLPFGTMFIPKFSLSHPLSLPRFTHNHTLEATFTDLLRISNQSWLVLKQTHSQIFIIWIHELIKKLCANQFLLLKQSFAQQ